LSAHKQSSSDASPDEPAVIGVAGGIGSGKSAVARSFARLGCVVIDSDKEARALLLRDDVKAVLVSWWGGGILDAHGEVDRSAVAKIVFNDPRERERLEGLTHPLLKTNRDRVRAEARSAGAPAVILDAPLLFEAGLDEGCDAVVFVDAPREVRLGRVREHRGWDEAELDRREKSQLALEEKRSRSHYVVRNDRDEASLHASVARILDEILTRRTKV
jgi:dephospho-CoA kinase